MFSVNFYNRSGSEIIPPHQINFKPVFWSGAVLGGPKQAEISATGESNALWSLLQWLRFEVRIVDFAGAALWWGYISEVVVTEGSLSLGLGTDSMYNRIRVLYSEEQADGSFEAKETAWSANTDSSNRYGTKELQLSVGDALVAEATQKRDIVLANSRYPQAIIDYGDMERASAIIRCRGWYDTLAWKYYEQTSGLEQFNASGNSSQLMGWGFTGTLSFTADNNEIHSMGAELDNLADHDQVVVTGSANNNGTHPIIGTPTGDAASYTNTTISFDTSNDTINDSAANLGIVSTNDVLQVSGSASNDGYYHVTAAGDASLTVSANLVNEAAGASVTLTRAQSVRTSSGLTTEIGAGSVTISAYGIKIAQSFTMSNNDPDWTVNDIAIRIKRVGSPGDNVKVSLYSDSGGSPSAELDSGQETGTDINTTMQWHRFTLNNTQAISFGTTYWIVVERTGGNSGTAYYMVDVDEDLGYGTGSLKVSDGTSWYARATDADMPFKVRGAWETQKQINQILTDSGTLLNSVDTVDTSGVYTNQFRDGKRLASDEITALVKTGTTNDRRLHVEIDKFKNAFIREEDAAPANPEWMIAADGTLRRFDGLRPSPGTLPYGEWVELRGLPLTQDILATISPMYIEEIEYDAEQDTYTPLFRGQRTPWEVGAILDG